MYSTCLMVMYASSPTTFRIINNKVCTIAKPENTAPATKYGGKMVVCQPGITEVAKSKDTIECTEKTSGVAKPASTKETSSNLCQSLARPLHPKDKNRIYFFTHGPYLLIYSITNHGEVRNKPNIPKH